MATKFLERMHSNCLKSTTILHCSVHNSFVKNDIWSTCEGIIHMSSYYKLSIGRMVYINGSAHNQLELVDVDPNDIKIG